MRTVRQRLIAEFVLLVLACVTLVWAGASWVVRDTFEDYVAGQQRLRAESLAYVLADYYGTYGSWDNVGAYLQGQPMMRGRGPMGQGAGRLRQVQDRVVIYDAGGRQAYDNMSEAGQVPPRLKILAAGITVGGRQVGSVAVAAAGSHGVIGVLEQAFFDRVRLVLALTGILSLVLAYLLGHRMAGGISRPLEMLRDAARGVASGDVGRSVDGDVAAAPEEVRELISDFNRMSNELALAKSRRTELLRDVAHEIRTPLTIIGGNLEGIAAGAVSLDKDTLEAMSGEVRRLEGLVSSLREIDPERMAAEISLAAASPSELVARAVASAQGAGAARGIRIESSVSSGLPYVCADPRLIQQVFSNLLSNALRYTPDRGAVLVEAALASPEDLQRFPAFAARSAQVVFRVRDSGPGIPPDDLERIFDRFYRGDKSRSRATGGWGLGLSIARSLVEKSGGVIWASNAEEGALFSFTLPTAAPKDVP